MHHNHEEEISRLCQEAANTYVNKDLPSKHLHEKSSLDLYEIMAAIATTAYELAQKWLPTHIHKKGGLYKLIGFGNHTETNQRFAVYEDAKGKLWIRPVEMFKEPGRYTPIQELRNNGGKKE